MNQLVGENLDSTRDLIQSKMDHDLRSNMNVVLGYCAMLVDDLEAGEPSPDLVGDIKCIAAAGRELLRLNSLVNDLLEVQRGHWKQMPGNTSLADVTDDAIVVLSERFPATRFTATGDARLACADRRSLTRLLEHVAARLCRATAVDLAFEITAREDGNSNTLEICCTTPPDNESEAKKLLNTLVTLSDKTEKLDNIQQFESFYQTVFCNLTGAQIDVEPASLTCRIMLAHQGSNVPGDS